MKLWVNRIHPTWEGKRKYLIKQGARIGKGTRLNCSTKAFGSEPYLITCGENCLFATDVHLITHDGGVKVLNALGEFGQRMDKIAPIVIGNNVYIGAGAYILPGVTIGDNVIIGAGAIVTKHVESGSVMIGVPARKYCTIDDYYERCKDDVEPTPGLSKKAKKEYYKNKYGLK